MAPYIKDGQYIIEINDLLTEQGPIRPPSEAKSLLIRVNRNCPWNRCEFCGTYKGGKFSTRSLEEIKSDINKSKAYRSLKGDYDRIRTAFLQDGNALALKTEVLIEVVSYLKEQFPLLQRITTYSSSRVVSGKKQEDLNSLRKAGLSRIHIGLETGYGPLLEYMRKGVTPDKHIEAGRKVKEAGISLSEYVLFGLGGQDWTDEHALATADVISQINPDFIRSRRLVVPPSIPLYEKMKSGEFKQLGDEGVVKEQQKFIENLEGITSQFVSDHMYNPLTELNGRLPEDKQEMLDTIDKFFNLSEEDRRIFILGSRSFVFSKLGNLYDSEIVYNKLRERLNKIKSEYSGGFDEFIFNLLASIGG